MRKLLLVAHLGVAKILLLLLDGVIHAAHNVVALVVHSLHCLGILIAGILGESFLCQRNLLAGLHDNGVLVEIVYVLAAVTCELFLNGLIEFRQFFLLYILTIVVNQRCHYVLVESLIPLVAVVCEGVVGLLLAVLRHHADKGERTSIELAGSCECLAPYCSELVSVEACGVKFFGSRACP